MTWLEKWAEMQVIGFYIGLIALALILIAIVIYFIVKGIKHLYKSHSKKYEWNCEINDYVKKEER